jgi:xylulokinase
VGESGQTTIRPDGGTCTVGVDIGTTSVKAVAVDARGEVVARTRVPHTVGTPTVDHLEHDAAKAWRRGPRRAFAQVSAALDGPAAGVVTTAMVPSITAVDRRGIPRLPGLLYGDDRARTDPWGGDPVARRNAHGGERGEGARMLTWAVGQMPDAAGYWPSQAVATHALSGVPAVDSAAATTFGPLVPNGRWDREALAALGLDESRVARIVPFGQAAGTVAGTSTVVGGGSIDAFCEQIVAGADEPGDVLVIFGATLIVWVVSDTWLELPGFTTFPSTAAGRVLIGGPSNAGGLFVDWVRAMVGAPDPRRASRGGAARAPGGRAGDTGAVPLWLPYLRGERTPFHDPWLRASLHGLDITMGPASVVRAAHEASGFVVRRMIERSGITPRRIVATGGGSRSTPWMEAVADATGLSVDTVAVPEGAALGAAFLARMTAGLESDFGVAASWAKPGRTIDPDPDWVAAASDRYHRVVELGPPD